MVLSAFLVYALGKLDILWTIVESGNMGFVVRGKSLFRIIHDVRGKKLAGNAVNGTSKFIDGEEKRTWLQKKFGLYWIGFPPASGIHPFKIKKESENPEGHGVENWTTGVKEATVTSLLHTFPRPFILRDVELKNRTRVNLLVVATFEVICPYIPVFKYKGDFFIRASSRIRSATDDIVKEIEDITAFIAAPKGEEGGILEGLKNPTSAFNLELVANVGIRLVGISIPQFDGDDAILAAANEESLAILRGKATVATANANRESALIASRTKAQQVLIETRANAASVVALGRARGHQIRETVAAMASTLGSKDVVAEGVTAVLEMEAATGPNSKLTTLVKGGGAKPVVPIGGGKIV